VLFGFKKMMKKEKQEPNNYYNLFCESIFGLLKQFIY